MTTLSNDDIKRDKLLAEGVNQLIVRGYNRLNLAEILKEADATKAFFYGYFKTKNAFVTAVARYYVAPFIRQLKTHLDANKEDVFSALIFYFDDLIHITKQNKFEKGCLFSNLMEKKDGVEDECRLALQSAIEEYRNALELGLQLAQQQGVLRTDKSAKRMADLLIDGWQGALVRVKIEQSTTPLERCCDDLLNDYFKASNRR